MHATTPKVMIQARADDMARSRGRPGVCKNKAKSVKIPKAVINNRKLLTIESCLIKMDSLYMKLFPCNNTKSDDSSQNSMYGGVKVSSMKM